MLLQDGASDRKDRGGTVGKPLFYVSDFSIAGTIHFTAPTAVQFSGSHISLTSGPLKLIPQLKHHLYPQPP